MLYNQVEATTATSWWGNQDRGNFFINIKDPVYKTYTLPDQINTVFNIFLKE